MLNLAEKMVNRTIQRGSVVGFHIKFSKFATETYNLLNEVYGNECLSSVECFKWFHEKPLKMVHARLSDSIISLSIRAITEIEINK